MANLHHDFPPLLSSFWDCPTSAELPSRTAQEELGREQGRQQSSKDRAPSSLNQPERAHSSYLMDSSHSQLLS